MKHLIAVTLLVLTLAACDNAADRAQKHFDSAVALLAEGDVDRALVELRNVFKYDDQHREGRRLMAATLHKRGDIRGAYANYLRLVEQYPDDAEGLTALAQLAFLSGDAAEARRRTEAALAVQPQAPALLAIDAALDFQDARKAQDAAAAAAAVKVAQGLLEADATLLPARQVVLADLVEAGNWDQALAVADAGLALDETVRPLQMVRLGILEQFGDKAGIEAALKRMIELYPDDPTLGATLVRWYLSEQRIDEAEAWLRGRITEGLADPEPRLTLVRFLAELRSTEAALAELDRVLALDPAPADIAASRDQFRALQAGFLFNAGHPDEAMAAMDSLLQQAEPSEQTNRIKVALARMRGSTGNPVGARALVEEVLAADPTQVDALKLKGGWLIEDDRTDEAVSILREAIGAAGRDTEAMTLLARAYERRGERPLARQMLAQAVEASNAAPAESLRYAEFLLQDQENRSAEDVLIAALRLDGSNLQLLSGLAQVHLAMQDWPRAEGDIARLREIGGEQGKTMADELQARLLSARGDSEELASFLEGLAGAGGLGAEAAVIQAQVRAGNIAQALERAQALAAANPDNPAAGFVLASVLALDGQTEAAEARLREVVAAEPRMERAWTALYGLRKRQGDAAGAVQVLDAAQAALPDSLVLQWTRAGLLEQEGDVEGAITLYEAIYAKNSNLPVIANNLASLLSSTRTDPDSLERAWTVARRLKDTKVPAFADTYGWIAFRRGEAAEALPYLELAAKGLPQDPTVQYHLGAAYAAQSRPEEARRQFGLARAALAAGGAGIPGLAAQIDQAEAALGG